MNDNDAEEFFAHYGVKGMKWGVRKRREEGGKPSRRERKAAKKEARAKNKAAKDKFYMDKAERVVQTALGKDKSLIKVMDHQGRSMVLTGEEFTDYLTQGGTFNVKWTDVYATQKNGKGPMVLNDSINAMYKKPKA